MEIYGKLDEIAGFSGPTVATIGNFDGVHCAHQHVLAEVVRRAHASGGRSLAITFDPHPTRVLRPEKAPKLITTLADKLALIAQQQVDAALVIPFSAGFAQTSAHDFCRFLVQQANVREIHEGVNFRFGRGAEADVKRMSELGRELDFAVVVYPEERIRGEAVSSSRIRALISDGRLNLARHLLGRQFFVRSTPAPGRGYGARYTVPTINLAPYPELLPANGVYVTDLEINGRIWKSVTNIGNRPTFGAGSFAVETHILDFEPMPLNEQTPLKLTFLRRLRSERKWPDAAALKAQIMNDVARARRWFKLAAAAPALRK
ncbi:MAG: bifunctional riboflavin kinase/FAD synthetase [Acidobacteriaceae bacterium]